MCLFLKNKPQALIADKDIICYKICEYYTKKAGKVFYTYYYGTFVALGRTYSSVIEINKDGEYSFEIEKALHSYCTFESAVIKLDSLVYHRHNSVAIIQCIIPMGSTYYIGNYDGPNDGYASNRLTYVELVKS